MNLDEVIETQAAIIEMQSGLIRKLEEKLKEGDHGL